MKHSTMWTDYKGNTKKIKDMSTKHIEHALLFLQCRFLLNSILLLEYKKDKEVNKEINERSRKTARYIVAFVRELKRRGKK